MEQVFTEAVDRLNRERRRLQALAQTATASGAFDPDGHAAMGRALSYVVMGGVLERLMRDLPRALATDIAALKLPRSKLPLGLVAALEASAFRRCGDDSVHSLLARAAVLQGALLHQNDVRMVEDFSDALRLADGSTVGQKNFEALWVILNLPGEWRNAPNDVFLLKEIKEKRNDIAHWEDDPVNVGRSKRPSALIGMVEQVVSLLDHVLLNLCYWFEERLST
ncbi:hypothetical protein ACIF85_16670 [Streptomyces sp. NPDC086033]|uniref:hypothetical protein n=1 Tax=Streptomyces sp. NPDC086033 TaxID=3365747 RepID=UPI0037CDA43C